MLRKMTAGDDEYREPNRILWMVIGAIAAAAVILTVGTFIVMRTQAA